MSAFENATNFFEAVDASEGWEGCKKYVADGATFSAQSEPLADIDTVEGYCECPPDLGPAGRGVHRCDVISVGGYVSRGPGLRARLVLDHWRRRGDGRGRGGCQRDMAPGLGGGELLAQVLVFLLELFGLAPMAADLAA